jgi:hypothetical protein
MPEFGRRPPGQLDVGPTYQGPRIGPNTQAMMDAQQLLSKRDTFNSDLQEIEGRLEKRILHLCLISGAIGTIVGFCIFVLVGFFI